MHMKSFGCLSEISQIQRQIANEYVAVMRGLSAFAQGAARHQFITKRMEAMGQHSTRLQTLVGEEEATRLLVETLELGKGEREE